MDLEGFVAEREVDLIKLFAIEGVSEVVGVAVEADWVDATGLASEGTELIDDELDIVERFGRAVNYSFMKKCTSQIKRKRVRLGNGRYLRP